MTVPPSPFSLSDDSDGGFGDSPYPPGRMSGEEKLSEPVRNQPFDEAMDVTDSSVPSSMVGPGTPNSALRTPTPKQTPKASRVVHNRAYDEEVELSLMSDDDDGGHVLTPRREGRDPPPDDERSLGVGDVGGAEAGDAGGTMMRPVSNDFFDAAFEVEDDPDGESSVDTRDGDGGDDDGEGRRSGRFLGGGGGAGGAAGGRPARRMERNAPAFVDPAAEDRDHEELDSSFDGGSGVGAAGSDADEEASDDGDVIGRRGGGIPEVGASSPLPTAATGKSAPPPSSAYNPRDYDDIRTTGEIRDLFKYITAYKPKETELDAPLKPFVPPYIPAVGEIDPFLKPSRPDGAPDELGLAVLDEPALEQSDPAVLELQLRALSKRRNPGNSAPVRSIKDAGRCPAEVERWIRSVEEVRRSRPPPEVHYRRSMPEPEELMGTWPEEFEGALRVGSSGGGERVAMPDPKLNLTVEEYATVLCSILGIPVHEGNIIQSVHMMMSLYLEFKSNESFGATEDAFPVPASLSDGASG